MAITFRDQKGAPLTHEELDANFRSFFFTASFGENNLTLIRKDGVSVSVPVGGQAFADFQANGGSIGDVYIANSQVTGSRMIIDLENGQFYDKTRAPLSDGGGLRSDEWYIDFAPSDGVDYFVHFGSSFAISSSGYLHASGARLEGDITASSGLIGGFNVNTDAITGPSYLGTPSFYISGSAGTNDHFISASNFSLKGSGDITGSAVLFSGGTIAGWDITNSQIRKSTNIVLDATNESISIKNSTFGNQGIQLEYNSGTPRFYVGNGTNSFVKFDGTDVTVSTRLLEISASNIEISSTEASMSLGNGNIELLGQEGKIVAGTTNKVRLEGNATDAFLVAGTKTGFTTNDAGIIIGMDATVPTLDLTKDASNYVRFDTSNGVDIKTDTFKLDTTYFDIDSSTQRINIFNTASAEIIRLGEISDDASDLYGIKIYDGSGTGSADTIAMFGQQGNKIGGWEVTGNQIRSIPNSGFGGTYAEGETGLVIHSSGRLESSNFVTNVKGWRIDTLGNGSAEFENMRIRGTLKTTVFEKESVNVVGGQLMVANATTIQPLRSEAGTIIAGSSSYADTAVTFSVANVSGFAEGEILKVKSVDDTGFSVEYLYVSGSSRYSQHSNLSYNTGSIDPDGLAGELYVERAFGGVVAVSSSLTTLAADISTTTETVITLASTASLAVQNILKIDNERFKIIGFGSNNTVNVIRNYGDTISDSHTSGDTVFLVDTDKEFLAGLVSTAKPYNEGQVLVSTGVYNPSENISSGYIMMNANPRDVSTPYMDIVERTGSGVYDLELRSRLGDLSGLSSAYLYGDNEPGFGLYTENGFFKGSITADTGSIAGILHVATVQGGLETGQKISIGRNVSGTNDGIFVNNNNYWYTDGAWKVGGQNNFISLDNFTDGNLVINTETFTLDTSTFIISSSLNSGTLKAGTNADTMTATAETGVYIDGTGKFRVGTGTSGTNYIYWDGQDLNIKGNVDITGGTGVTQNQLNTATGSAISSSNAFTNEQTASLATDIEVVTDGLDAKIFTDTAGRAVRPPTASAEGLYLTSTNLGFYKSGAWKTYMDNSGDFFLTGSNGDKLAWDSSTGTLEIKGAINITGNGNAATTTYASASAAAAESASLAALSNTSSSLSASLGSSNASLQSAVDAVDTLASGKTSIFRSPNQPSTTGRTNGDMWIESDAQNKVYIFSSANGGEWLPSPDGTYDQEDLINATSSSLSSSIALDLFTDSTGKLKRPPTASATGLYLGDSNLGYYDNGQWKTYMADNGNFFLTGSATNYLYWDGNALNIAGSINITSGNAATTSSVDTAVSGAIDSGSAAAATAEANAQTYTNQATSSLSGSLLNTLDNISGSLANDISSSSATTTNISASQAAVNEGLQGVLDGKNAIFRQPTTPTATAEGDIWIETDQNNRVRVWTGTQWLVSSDSTYDQETLILNKSGSIAADIFTDSTGKIQKPPNASGAGLYLGDSNLGYYDGNAWATYMADNGNFFLTGSSGSSNYLAWNGTSLTISGNINVVGGNAATSTTVSASVAANSASMADGINNQVSEVSASTALAQQTATLASSEATLAEQTALTASLNALNAITRSVDASGKIVFPATPSGDGLYAGADRLGFYGSNIWKTYMSSSGDFFLVGDGNNGLSWDGSDLSVDGTIVARSGSIGGIELAAAKMYIGTGTFNNTNTEFYVDNAGNFSLGNKLVWNGSTLAISGNIVITGGATADAIEAAQSTANTATGSASDAINAASTAQTTANAATSSAADAANAATTAQTTANAATSSAADAANLATTGAANAVLSGSAAAANAVTSGSAFASNAVISGSVSASAVQSNLNTATGSLQTYANTAASVSASAAQTAAQNYTDENAVANSATSSMLSPYTTNSATSSLVNPATYSFHGGTGGGGFPLSTHTAQEGLNLTSEFMGYYSGSGFKSFLSSSGDFMLSSDSGDALTWTATNGVGSLRIGQKGVGPTLLYQFSGSLNSNVFLNNVSNVIEHTGSAQNPIIGVILRTNSDGWNQGIASEAVFDREDSNIFEWDLVVGPRNARAMFGLYNENFSSYSYTHMSHAIYLDGDGDIHIYEDGANVKSNWALDDWENDPDYSQDQRYRLRIQILDTGAKYEVFKDGDFKAPHRVYQTNTQTDRYLRQGIAIFESDANTGVIIQALSGGTSLGQATKISGNTIQTGKLQSFNYDYTSGDFSDNGTEIDLDNGKITAEQFSIDGSGNAKFKGELSAATGTFAGSLRVGQTNTTVSNVVDGATSGSTAQQNDSDKTDGTVGGWTIDGDAIYSGTKDTNGYTNGGITFNSGGSIHSKNFYISQSGDAFFKGDITGASGTFSGTIQVGGTTLTESNTLNSNVSASDVGGLAAVAISGDPSDVGLGNVDNVSQATIQSASLAAATADDVGLGNVDNTSDATVLSSAATAANTADKTDGTVGGWSIDSNYIFSGTKKTSDGFADSGITLAHTNNGGAIRAEKFYISTDGNAFFKGDITGASGTFSGTVEVGGTPLTTSNTLNTTDPMSAGAVNFNPNFLTVASDGRPAGARAVYGSSTLGNISYSGSSDDGVLKLHSPTNDTSIGAGFSAFKINPGAKYKFVIRIKSSTAEPKGMYIRFAEYHDELASNNDTVSWVGQGSTSAYHEPGVQVANSTNGANITTGNNITDSTIDGANASSLENIGTTTSYRIIQGIYTPTSGASSASSAYASLYILNWTDINNTNNNGEYHIDKVYISETTEDLYTGTVAGWTIDDTAIFTGTKDTNGYTSGGITLSSGGSIHSKEFYIDTDGNANFKGDISAATGTISNSISIGSSNDIFKAGPSGIQLGHATFASAPFRVNMDGDLTATNATVGGTLTAGNNSQIGNWVVSNGDLRDSATRIELDPTDKAIRLRDTGGTTRVTVSSVDLPSVSPTRETNFSVAAYSPSFLTKTDSTSNSANSTFDSNYNLNSIGNITYGTTGESFGRTNLGLSNYATSSVFAHPVTGDLPFTMPVGASKGNTGKWRVQVDDFSSYSYNNQTYYIPAYGQTWYDVYDNSSLQLSLKFYYKLQKESSGGSQGGTSWTDVMNNTITFASVNTAANFTSSKDDLSPLTSNLYFKERDFEDIGFTWDAQMLKDQYDDAPAGNYRLISRWFYDYTWTLYLTQNNRNVGVHTQAPSIQTQVILYGQDFSSAPVTFGTFQRNVAVGLNGMQVSGVSGSVLLGEVNESGAATVYGDALVTGQLTANTTALSDQRLKSNIQNIPDPLTTIESLTPRKFKWEKNINPFEVRGDSFGFIAQEMSGSLPQLVSSTRQTIGHTQNLLSVDQMPIIALNTAGIQELIAKLNTLETKVEQLEAQISGSE